MRVDAGLPVDERICRVAVRTILPVCVPIEASESRPVRVPFEAEAHIGQLNDGSTLAAGTSHRSRVCHPFSTAPRSRWEEWQSNGETTEKIVFNFEKNSFRFKHRQRVRTRRVLCGLRS